ncbi:hypothetical protein DYBT9275_00252 [Dyadobacter sp. CECT 9275]|uniref:Uncharacterized protein n=1 Tax=Dyadobacter helix TaxID=2822344 RepID=A0A916J6Q0_9BACT|nr:hypothetical protein [Dyadobacter sp. CECT 9275]CAG4989246.1 hypothetical protein DYBT9275_00252 [Dyadobacter sp. CECT 9275]
MKKQIITLILIIFCLNGLFARDEKYIQAMSASISALNGLDKGQPAPKALQEIANRFERIGAEQAREWLPCYYAALCYIKLGFVSENLAEKDRFLDLADAMLKQAETLAGKPNDELLILLAYAAQSRLAADAMNRWEEYGEKFANHIQAAQKLNPGNPRSYYLEGAGLFYTPEQYGGGKEAAKPTLSRAVANYASFKPETTIHPDWGKEEAAWLLGECNK